MLPRSGEIFRIDRQAMGWLQRLTKCWLGPNPCLFDEAHTLRLFLHHEMLGPLPHDRLELIRMATNREKPNREAFVTLALIELPEDYVSLPIGERSAKLPYQLAWARAGVPLGAISGMPGGIQRASWPS